MEEFVVRGSGGLQTFLQNILGTYTPSDPSSMAGADWQYIFSGIIFCIVLYCTLRILGSLFK